MKLYYYEFKGVVLGGEAIVIAPSKKVADQTLLANGPLEDLKLEKTTNIPKHRKVIHFWNGDY